MTIRSFFTICLLSLTFFSQAQSYLYLERKGEVPDQRWEQGDKIEILLLNGEEKVWKQGYFNGGDSLGMVIGTQYYAYTNIAGVRYAYGIMPLIGKASLYGAALFTGIFTANGIINDDSPILRQEHIVVGVSLLGLGLISKPFWYKKRLMEKGYYFRIINPAELDK